MAVSELMKIFRQFHMYLDRDSLFPHSIRTDLTSFFLISFWLPGLILTIKKCSLFCKIVLYNTCSLNDLNIDYMFEQKKTTKKTLISEIALVIEYMTYLYWYAEYALANIDVAIVIS